MAASASAARTLSRYTGQLSNRATTDHWSPAHNYGGVGRGCGVGRGLGSM